jgi:hypothetical protein
VAMVVALATALLGLGPVVTATAQPTAGGGSSASAKAAHPHIMKPHKKGQPAGGPGVDTTTDMSYHGGVVMRSVTNYAIFWNPTTQPAGYPGAMFDSNFRSIVDRYFHDIGGTPYFNILTQYGDNSGLPVPNATSFGGDWVDTTTFPHAGTNADPLQDGDIRASIDRAIAANPTWQGPGNSTMYYVYTGKNVIECQGGSCFAANDYLGNSGSNGAYCAYHWNNGSKIYAYIPYASTGGCYGDDSTYPNGLGVDKALDVTSHEQFEAYTDPFQNAWYDNVDLGAGENGDKCNFNYGPYEPDGTNLVLNGHPYQLQREWSNGSPHACVKRYGARPTTTITGDLNFGAVARGTSVIREVALQNTGNGDLDVLDAFLGSGSSSSLSLSPVAPFHSTLHNGETALFDVTASPPASSSTTGPISGSLVVDTDDTVPNDTGAPTNAQLTATNTIPATATVGLPNVTLSGSLDFGTVPRGTSATRNVVVQNIGPADLHVSNVTISGDSTFTISPTSPTSGTLPTGGTLTVEVKFSPPASAANGGPLSATLTVATDDPATPSVTTTAKGVVGIPQATVTPPSLDFGVVCPGGSVDRDLTVTNTGTAPLTITNIGIGGGSSAGLSVLAPPTLPVTLAVGAHLAFSVRFTPPGPLGGPVSGTVVVTTDDPASPTISVPITGSTGQAVLSLSTTSLDFGGIATDDRTSPSSKDKKLTLTNTGNCSMTLGSLSIAGAASTDFTVVGGASLPVSITSGGSVTITVRFNPSAAGPRNAILSVATSDPAHPSVDVALTGTGLVPAILTAPTSVAFGPTVIQSQAPGYSGVSSTVTVTNTGQSELIVDQLGTTAPFSAPGAVSPPSRYAANDHFGEAVTFAPTTVGKLMRNLLVADNDPEGGASAAVPLCGEGVLRGIRVLAVNSSGVPFTSIGRLKLQSHGTATNVNLNKSNLPLVSVPNSCDSAAKMQFDQQGLPTAGTVNQRSSYYTLAITAGGKSTTTTFTLGVSEFKVLVITIK